ALTADPNAFHCTGVTVGKAEPRFAWKQVRYAGNTVWPAPGVRLILHFAPPEGVYPGLTVDVHYEMYDGLPVLAKWFTLHNGTVKHLHLVAFKSEILAVVEAEAYVEEPTRWEYPGLHIDSDYAFLGMDPKTASKTAFWVPDPQYLTQ